MLETKPPVNLQPVEIRLDQHIDYISRDTINGVFWYHTTDKGEEAFVGIFKPHREAEVQAFATKAELIVWLAAERTAYEKRMQEYDAEWDELTKPATQAEAADEEDPFGGIDLDEVPGVPAEAADEEDPFGGIELNSPDAGPVEPEPQPESEPEQEIVVDLAEIEAVLKVQEDDYIEAFKAHGDVEAEYKKRLQAFNDANAELIADKTAAEAIRDKAEERLRESLVAWGQVSGKKKFDEYLSVKAFVEYEIDEAKATTWAEQNYPAAISKVTNQKLIADYAKSVNGKLDFVKTSTVIKPQISKKF